ncbi:hypothetical protein L3X07_03400 [Levilactobacillus brevis]|nr:hypothetical protein [Levilactobacillus brevis]
MTLEQLYIKSLDIPAIEFKITGKYIDTVFKSGKILTSRYQAMLTQLPRRNGFTILRHSQTLFTFCFIKGMTTYLIGPEIINIPSADNTALNDRIIYLSKRLNTTILEKEQCYKQILFLPSSFNSPSNERPLTMHLLTPSPPISSTMPLQPLILTIRVSTFAMFTKMP